MNILKKGLLKVSITYRLYDIVYILYPTELHLKNVYYLYSACSNPTDVVLVIVLVIA